VEIPHSGRSKDATECKLLKYEWVTTQTGQDAELKAENYGKNSKKG